MADKITTGWCIHRKAHGEIKERWIYSTLNQPYKRRSDAVKNLTRFARIFGEENVELNRIDMFYTIDNA